MSRRVLLVCLRSPSLEVPFGDCELTFPTHISNLLPSRRSLDRFFTPFSPTSVMPSPKRERKILIDLDAQPMPLPDVVVSDRPELIVDLGNLRPPSEIKVMAIGQGGIKAAQVLIEKGYTHVDYIACDTDVALLAETSIPVRLQLGNSGIGTGNNPSLARDEAVASTDKIIRALAGDTKILFLPRWFGAEWAPVAHRSSRESHTVWALSQLPW